MTNKLEIHGLDLSEMGIGDVGTPAYTNDPIFEHFVRQILGSITFGHGTIIPIEQLMGDGIFIDPLANDDDPDWGLAE